MNETEEEVEVLRPSTFNSAMLFNVGFGDPRLGIAGSWGRDEMEDWLIGDEENDLRVRGIGVVILGCIWAACIVVVGITGWSNSCP